MAYSETIQQVSAKAKAEALFSEAEAEALIAEIEALKQQGYAEVEAIIAEAKAITANFRLNRDERELNERLLALGIALIPGHGCAEIETEKRFLALGFITGVISDGREFAKNLLALVRAIHTDF